MPRREPPRGIPPYLATGGRTQPRHPLPDVLTRLVWLRGDSEERLDPVQQELFDAVRGGSVTLAEAAVYLSQPLFAVRILASDLMERKLIQAAPPSAQSDISLLETVLHGLRKLKDTA
ncbi:DUF742 domain-containing protein [Streptomyces sp. NPDC057552]|uniref:DUF742 domain-containing protein n=1 Tax=Streptomyces sp. NPDC057552 TaxID=3350537 RepID=UPI0036C24240